MKEKLKNSPLLQGWFDTQSPLVITRPALRETLICAVCLLGGFLLACGRLGEQPAPFALALLASLGGGLRGLSCLIGLAAGYLGFQPFSQGLQMLSAGILIYVCDYIFGTLWVTKRTWFRCGVAAAMTALVGSIFLLSQPVTLESAAGYGQTVLLAGLTPPCYEQLGKKRTPGSLLALGTFLLGSAAITLPFGVRLGCLAAVALVGAAARQTDLPTAAALSVGAGLALDGALGGGFWTLVLGCGGLFGAGVSRRHPALRAGVFILAAAVAMLFAGSASPAQWLTLGAGTALSLLMPAGLLAGQEESAVRQSAALVEERLRSGQTVLRRLYDAIGVDPERREEALAGQVFDRAAAKVCRRCARRDQCWEKEAQATYRTLRPALAAMLERGAAQTSDFPQDFLCVRLEALTEALDQELDRAAARDRDRSRREEERTVVSRYLLHLSAMLERNVRLLRAGPHPSREAYTAKLGVAARGRSGSTLSGDRGASFRTEDGLLYVVLCDGAGTGAPAAEESLLAVDALVELIQAGMPPQNAMELLNGMYILRDSGGFATMDVLELSLLSGQATLYKWGAAPSYVKSGSVVKRLGTPAPPPGLSGTARAEALRLSLWNGDMLVLVSDGVDSDETELLLRSFEGDNVKDLACLIIDRAVEQGGGDDMTAAVIRMAELHP